MYIPAHVKEGIKYRTLRQRIQIHENFLYENAKIKNILTPLEILQFSNSSLCILFKAYKFRQPYFTLCTIAFQKQIQLCFITYGFGLIVYLIFNFIAVH